jgi:FKBP-type peptidyl-prolyl cis-trans isomerase SlyD
MTDDQTAESTAEPDAADAEEAVEEDVEEEIEEEATGLQQGDFVRLAYTMRTLPEDDDEEGMVVDTTDEEVAKESDIDTDEYEFEPRIIILGEGHVFEAVDDALLGSEAGDAGTVTIPAAEAFGEVDESEIRTVSASKIDEDDRYPGAQVQIDGEQGRIETIIGGRARVNFNHPLAGEDLEYEYEILEIVDDRTEKAKGLFGLYLQQTPELWIQTDEVEEEVRETPEESQATGEAGDEVESDDGDEDEDAEPEFETETVEKETLYIEATPQMTMNQQWLFSKQQIAQDVMNRLDLDRVIVQETIDGMGGMMGGMGGMMGGMGGGAPEDIEEAMDDVDLDDVDVDADEIAEELDADLDEE